MEHILTDCNKDASKDIICGDINVNMLNSNNCISAVLDVYGATNIVNIKGTPQPGLACFFHLDLPLV